MKAGNPYFTVVIPTFNRAEFLKSALDSIWAQNCKDYEVVVVDDGSTDGTWAYLQTLKDKVKSLRQQNKGPGAARNAGAGIAIGRYIAFLDSDDCWFPWTLSTYKSVIQDCGDPSWVAGSFVEVTGATEHTINSQSGNRRVACYRDYLQASPVLLSIGVPAVAVKCDVFKKHLFDEKNLNSEDNDLWLRLGVERNFCYVSHPPLFAYRRHPQSRTSDLSLTLRGSLELLRRERDGLYPGGVTRREERQFFLGIHLRPIAVACVRAGRFHEAFIIYKALLRANLTSFRLKFLLGLPLLALYSLIKRCN
jgi:glycosyltransferase involved in cell wall biosynthesis